MAQNFSELYWDKKSLLAWVSGGRAQSDWLYNFLLRRGGIRFLNFMSKVGVPFSVLFKKGIYQRCLKEILLF